MAVFCDACERILDYPGSCGCLGSRGIKLVSPISDPDADTIPVTDTEVELIVEGVEMLSDNPF